MGQEFWSWFSAHATTIGEMLDLDQSGEISLLMKEGVAMLPRQLGWEFGPGVEKKHMFSLSLKGILSSKNIADAFLEFAPSFQNWELYSSLPPKEWALQFIVKIQGMQELSIDAGEWVYSLTSFSKGSFFDITILAANLEHVDKVERQTIGALLLIGILGEVDFLKRIDRTSVFVDPAMLDEQQAFSKIKHLRNHIAYLDDPPR